MACKRIKTNATGGRVNIRARRNGKNFEGSVRTLSLRNYSLALDEVERAMDDVVETEANQMDDASSANSAMQVSWRNTTKEGFLVGAIATGIGAVIVIGLGVANPLLPIAALVWYLSWGILGCYMSKALDFFFDRNGGNKCARGLLLLPFKPFFIAGRYLQRKIRGSPKKIAGATMDEPPLNGPLVNETS